MPCLFRLLADFAGSGKHDGQLVKVWSTVTKETHL